MVAYNFKLRFLEAIVTERKRHTVRFDRKRHAREGEALQLYTGMRTRHCMLIGRAVAMAPQPIELTFRPEPKVIIGGRTMDPERFALSDGFECWSRLVDFWDDEHSIKFSGDTFIGVLIPWHSFEVAP